MAKTDFRPGVGLDIGTMNIVSARKNTKGNLSCKRIRDAFLDIPKSSKKLLRMNKIQFVDMEQQDTLLVLGDSALELAVLLGRDARRPLSRGVISSGELDAQEVLRLLTISVLDETVVEKEPCYFSIPANPIDDPSKNVTYHQNVFHKILEQQGYAPHATNEAMAIIYSQCFAEQFSGLAISFGAGMVNVALSYKTFEIFSFSLARGGDWVDERAASSLGLNASYLCTIKERGVDLLNPQGREAEAISIYLRDLIRYCLVTVINQMQNYNVKGIATPIPLVVSGGATQAKNFLEVFKQELAGIRSKVPFEFSGVRLANDPLNAVAEGLLVLASVDSEDE